MTAKGRNRRKAARKDEAATKQLSDTQPGCAHESTWIGHGAFCKFCGETLA